MSGDYGAHTISRQRRCQLLAEQNKMLREAIASLKLRHVVLNPYEKAKILDADCINIELKKYPDDPNE